MRTLWSVMTDDAERREERWEVWCQLHVVLWWLCGRFGGRSAGRNLAHYDVRTLSYLLQTQVSMRLCLACLPPSASQCVVLLYVSHVTRDGQILNQIQITPSHFQSSSSKSQIKSKITIKSRSFRTWTVRLIEGAVRQSRLDHINRHSII